MSHLTKLLVAGCIATAFACGGKASTDASAGGSPGGSAAAVATLNANCPMMGEPVTAEGGTVTYQGHAIGFCCDGCAPKFAKLSDTEKVAALAKHGTTLPE